MIDFFYLCILILILALPGIIFAFILTLSPIRKRIQKNNQIPTRILLLFGCLSFVLTFGFVTRIMTEIDYTGTLIDWGYQQRQIEIEKAQQDKDGIILELWLRYLLLYPKDEICLSGQQAVCQFWGYKSRPLVPFFVGTTVISPVVFYGVVKLLSRCKLE